jgi:hypothetical protein
MNWEPAIIVGSLGASFYLLYLSTIIENKHSILKVGLMLTSFLTVLLSLAHIHQLILFVEPTATPNINIASQFYSVWVWITIGFLSYWFIFVAGGWIRSWLAAR